MFRDRRSGLFSMVTMAAVTIFSLLTSSVATALEEQRVNTYISGQQWEASVAQARDGSFVVVWVSAGQDGDSYGVFGKAFGTRSAGPEFQINELGEGLQRFASVGIDDVGRFVVAWVESKDGMWRVKVRRYTGLDDPNGAGVTPLGPEITVGERPESQSAAWDISDAAVGVAPDGKFVVAWVEPWLWPDEDELRFRVYDDQDVPAPLTPILLAPRYHTNGIRIVHNPKIGAASWGFFLVWLDNGASLGSWMGDVVSRRYGWDGQSLDTTTTLIDTTVEGAGVDVAMTPQETMLVAYRRRQEVPIIDNNVYLVHCGANGPLHPDPIQVNPGYYDWGARYYNTGVGVAAGGLDPQGPWDVVVVWNLRDLVNGSYEDSILARHFIGAAAPTPTSADATQLDTLPGDAEVSWVQSPIAMVNLGEIRTVWDAAPAGDFDIYLRCGSYTSGGQFVAEPCEGQVELIEIDTPIDVQDGTTLDFTGYDVILKSGGELNVGSGSFTLVTDGALIVEGGARISAEGLGTEPGGSIQIEASDVTVLGEISADSGDSMHVISGAPDAGSITIQAGSLTVQDGGRIGADGKAPNSDGGTVTALVSGPVEILGGSTISTDGASVKRALDAPMAGQISILAADILVDDDSRIGADGLGPNGEGGEVELAVPGTVTIGADSLVSASGGSAKLPLGAPNGGVVAIYAEALHITETGALGVTSGPKASGGEALFWIGSDLTVDGRLEINGDEGVFEQRGGVLQMWVGGNLVVGPTGLIDGFGQERGGDLTAKVQGEANVAGAIYMRGGDGSHEQTGGTVDLKVAGNLTVTGIIDVSAQDNWMVLSGQPTAVGAILNLQARNIAISGTLRASGGISGPGEQYGGSILIRAAEHLFADGEIMAVGQDVFPGRGEIDIETCTYDLDGVYIVPDPDIKSLCEELCDGVVCDVGTTRSCLTNSVLLIHSVTPCVFGICWEDFYTEQCPVGCIQLPSDAYCAQCIMGPCCQNGLFVPADPPVRCDTTPIPDSAQYRCTTDQCPAETQIRERYRHCSGNSGSCTNDNILYSDWETETTCANNQVCQSAAWMEPTCVDCAQPAGIRICEGNQVWAQSDTGVCVAGQCDFQVLWPPIETCAYACFQGACTDPLPPDPSDPNVRPDIEDTTRPTNLYESTEFFYTGADPIQKQADPAEFQEWRVSVIRGLVKTQDNVEIPNVKITVLGHPEHGHTFTRADGLFDIVVNGGGPLTFVYEKDGFFTAQRTVDVPWQVWTWAPDVVLVEKDPEVSTVQVGSSYEIHWASFVGDSDGARRAAVVFPPGITATKVVPGQQDEVLTQINVRASEYTVGPTGEEAMPALLPPTSQYTYAVELSVDEIEGVEGARIEFSGGVGKVFFYLFVLQDFVDFGAGEIVPVGTYDRERGEWVPSDNGIVMTYLGVDGLGRALLDIDEVPGPDDVSSFMTDQERTLLPFPELQPGMKIWRVELDHFSPVDCNWGPIPPPDADPPPTPDDRQEPEMCTEEGSVIRCQDQTLTKQVPIVGTPYTLNYSSERVPGRKAAYTLRIPLRGPSLPSALEGIKLEVTVAGQRETKSWVPPPPDFYYDFTWDGKDALDRKLYGTQKIVVRIGYIYDGYEYGTNSEYQQAFAALSNFSTLARVRGKAVMWRRWQGTIGAWDARGQGLGGWTLDVHHVYDPTGRVLYLGDGRKRTARETRVMDTVAGTGVDCLQPPPACGDLGPAKQADLGRVHDVVVGPDGSFYIASGDDNRIRKVAPDGTISTLVGTGLVNPNALAFGPDGSLYVAETFTHRVWKLDLNSLQLTPFAGNGQICTNYYAQVNPDYCGDGGLATDAELDAPEGIVVTPDGSLYVADFSNFAVRRVAPSGIIQKAVGNGTQRNPCVLVGDGGPAYDAGLYAPNGLAVGPDGSLYIADGMHVRRVSTDGMINTVAGWTGGSPCFGYGGDGDVATNALLRNNLDVAVDPDGGLYISDYQNSNIRYVDKNGIISTLAGDNILGGFGGDGGPPQDADLYYPEGLDVGPDGNLYIADSTNARIRRVRSLLPSFSGVASTFDIPAQNGSMIYRFDGAGKHVATFDALRFDPLQPRYQFFYDSTTGFLNAVHRRVTDTNALVTQTTTPSDGAYDFAVQGEYLQKTDIDLDAEGFLHRIKNPAGETHKFTYDTNPEFLGLLTTFYDPRSVEAGDTYWYEYAYDAEGRLTSADDPAGGNKTLARNSFDDGYSVEVQTLVEQGQRRTTTYRTEYQQDAIQVTNTFPGNLETHATLQTDGTQQVVYPDGTSTTVQFGPDPRWGIHARYPRAVTTQTPGGTTREFCMDRKASLIDNNDPTTLVSITERMAINNCPQDWDQPQDPFFSRTYTAATGQWSLDTPEGRQFRITRDGQGKITEVQMSGLDPVQYVYDSHGRLWNVIQGQRVWTFQYYLQTETYPGRLKSIENPEGQFITYNEYDEAGRVTRLTLPGGRQVGHGYDENGNATTVSPVLQPAPVWPDHGFQYTPVNLVEQYQPPAPDTQTPYADTRYEYNLARQLDKVKHVVGQSEETVLDLDYNELGHVATVQLALRGEMIVYTYDQSPVRTGQLLSIAGPDNAVVEYQWDGFLLKEMKWRKGGSLLGSVSRDYNNNFRVAARTVAAPNTVSIPFTYDNDGLLRWVGAMEVFRDEGTRKHGLVSGTQLGSVVTSRSHNWYGEIAALTATDNSSPLYSLIITDRDNLGRITAKEETIQSGDTTTYAYGYDSEGRLETVTKTIGAGPPVVSTYTYDSNGNRTSAPNLALNNAYYDDQDRLTGYGSTTYEWTVDGRLDKKTLGAQVTTYDYDVLGNLRSVQLPGNVDIVYVIDGENRRIGRAKYVGGNLEEERYYLYKDRLNPVAELDGSGNLISRFVYGTRANVPDYMIKGGQTYRIVSDHLGSVRLVVNVGTGDIAQRMEYDEFGRVLDDNPGFQPFGFAGGLYDPDTGLVRFGARDYDPEVGRWTGKDPTRFDGRDTNLFGYALGDPINRFDPEGKVGAEAVLETGWAIAAGEPTPVGEIAMAVVTAGILAYWAYQLATREPQESLLAGACGTILATAAAAAASMGKKPGRCKCLCYDNQTFFDAKDAQKCNEYCVTIAGTMGGRCI